MKRIILILSATALMFASCKKEEELCNTSCGTIINDGIDADGCYWLEIQNECSGNNKVFCFDQNTWQNNYVGGSFCVSNQPSW